MQTDLEARRPDIHSEHSTQLDYGYCFALSYEAKVLDPSEGAPARAGCRQVPPSRATQTAVESLCDFIRRRVLSS